VALLEGTERGKGFCCVASASVQADTNIAVFQFLPHCMAGSHHLQAASGDASPHIK